MNAAQVVLQVIDELDGRFDRHASSLADALETASSASDPQSATRRAPDAPQAQAAVSLHLDDALGASRAGSAGEFVRALEPVVACLHWSQTSAYVRDPPYPGFLDHYAHTTLLGSPELTPLLRTRRADVRCGLLLLGPNHDYPPHAHPAEEIYLPLTEARWTTDQQTEGRIGPAGSLIHHRPGQPHGITTGTAPLLAAYLWLGDTTVPAHFTG